MANLVITDLVAILNARIGDLARALLGEPNSRLSNKAQLRFGSKGSVVVEIEGPNAGKWFDHEAGIGGAGLELIRHRRGGSLGAAVDWARQWLGVEQIAAPDDFLKPAAQSAASGLNRSPSTARSEDKGEKVSVIVRACEPATGTPAELYLRRRGITASLPDSIRYRPNAFGNYGALVALAVDTLGKVLAVQQIYITKEGEKAPLKVVKRTNKACEGWSSKAAVRFPGQAPIVLAEGVETALSVWQATGRETWACLGIANIARAPAPAATSPYSWLRRILSGRHPSRMASAARSYANDDQLP